MRQGWVVLSGHQDETLVAETEDVRVTMVLEKARRRFDGGDLQTRYRFELTARAAVAEDAAR